MQTDTLSLILTAIRADDTLTDAEKDALCEMFAGAYEEMLAKCREIC